MLRGPIIYQDKWANSTHFENIVTEKHFCYMGNETHDLDTNHQAHHEVDCMAS